MASWHYCLFIFKDMQPKRKSLTSLQPGQSKCQFYTSVTKYSYHSEIYWILIWCDFDRASSLICGNKMPTRCNRGFYCRSYCLFNMFQSPLCPSSGAQEYYTVVAACGILCCGFSSSWSDVELRVMRPVCRMLVYHTHTHTHTSHTPNIMLPHHHSWPFTL